MAGAEVPEDIERAAAVAEDHQHSQGNVTFDPLARAIPAANPEIKEVLGLREADPRRWVQAEINCPVALAT